MKVFDHSYYDLDHRFWLESKVRQLEERLNKCVTIMCELGMSRKDAEDVVRHNPIIIVERSSDESVDWSIYGISYDTGKKLLRIGKDAWQWCSGCGSPYRGVYFTENEELARQLTNQMQPVNDWKWQFLGKLQDLLG